MVDVEEAVKGSSDFMGVMRDLELVLAESLLNNNEVTGSKE